MKKRQDKGSFYTTNIEPLCKKRFEWDDEMDRIMYGHFMKLVKDPDYAALITMRPQAAIKWFFSSIPTF